MGVSGSRHEQQQQQQQQAYVPPQGNPYRAGGGVPPAAQAAPLGNQMANLYAHGVRPDIAFQHHQMPRSALLGEHSEQKDRQVIRIEGDMAVAKNSLCLVRSPDGNRHSVAFNLDALVPVRVRVYLLATEVVDERHNTVRFEQSVLKREHAPTPTTFAPGKGLHFEQPPDEGLDLGEFTEEQLSGAASPDLHPIVICMERITDDNDDDEKKRPAAAEATGHRMDMMVVYCTVSKRGAGGGGGGGGATAAEYAVKVARQKIMVAGFAYDLQEIYGLDSEADASDCVVCLSAPRDTTLLPCRHMCVCQDCSNILGSQTNRCPICRSYVVSTLHIVGGAAATAGDDGDDNDTRDEPPPQEE